MPRNSLASMPEPLPAGVFNLLAKDLTARAAVIRLATDFGIHVDVQTVQYQRRKLFPGRNWPKRPPPGSRALAVLTELCAEVRRFNLRWIAEVNASRKLRGALPIHPYAHEDLW